MNSYQLQSMATREPIKGFVGRFVHSDNMTMAFWNIRAGSAAATHQHPHEQVFCLLEGEFELTVDEKSAVYAPGAVVVIPPSVPHSARAITNSRVLDIFHPVREDLR